MSTLTAFFASSSFILVLGVIALAVAGLQGWLVWRLIQALGAAARMEEKLGHFGDALSLLTETTEAGFVAVADELSKQSGASLLSKPKAISNARIHAASRRGSSVAEIAASEQLSESEVRLRMHLSKAMSPAARASKAPALDKAPRSARKPPVRKSGLPSPVSEEMVNGALRA